MKQHRFNISLEYLTWSTSKSNVKCYFLNISSSDPGSPIIDYCYSWYFIYT